MLTIEGAWQDWTRSDLKPNSFIKYGQAYMQRIKSLAPQIEIQSHLDIGSKVKRDCSYIRKFSAYSHRAGFDSPSYYEYSIQDLQ